MFFFNRQEVHSYGFPPGSSGLACWLVILPKDLHVNFVDTTGKPFKYLSKQFIRRTPAVDILEKAWDRLTVPILDEEGKMAGSVLILDFASKEQLDAYLAHEPYILENVWEKVQVEPMNVVIVDGTKVGK